MPAFSGFPGGKVPLIPVPAPFFSQLLPDIDSLEELKVILYTFWFLDHQEGEYRYITRRDFTEDELLSNSLDEAALAQGLQLALEHGLLLEARQPGSDQVYYFLNSPRGRAAAQLTRDGKWKPGGHQAAQLVYERPNIFRLYEEHIGPLTPLMSDSLKEAETLYPADWIIDAFRLAVHKNARNWRYIEAILRSWQEKGRHETDQRGNQEDYRQYGEGEFADFIEH
ncbi:MAG: DnaD domain protein [Anaerolineae bacterium]|nr:DnaD domain protein [Anaerolineae bacterium]